MLDYRSITKRYYAEWLDCDAADFEGGVRYICSPKRDIVQFGYSRPYALSLFKTNNAVIVSYSSKIQKQINQMKLDFLIVHDFDVQLDDYLDNLFAAKPKHNLKFVFNRQLSNPTSNVIALSKDNYDLFLNFRLADGKSVWDGMREYFTTISNMGYCLARMADGKPVSVTDAPPMPYIPDMVQEIGINTLPEYRNRGYAKEVVSGCISKIISDNKCPMWSCDGSNLASERLAYSVGFKNFCDVYSIVL